MAACVKITNEAYKIRWDHSGDPIPALSHLVAARNDTAAFQLVLQSNYPYSVAVRPVEWFAHKSIARVQGPHERIRVALSAPFAATLQVEGMMTDHDETKKAEVLLTQDVLNCPANLPTGVWAELRVPADAAPGKYTVTATVYSSFAGEDERVVLQQEIPLTVGEYTLPDWQERGLYLNLWQHVSSLAWHHDVPMWSDEHFAVIENYVAALTDLGQRSITVCAAHIPWGGQSCSTPFEHAGNLFQYSMIGITKKSDGTFLYDYSVMQRYIDLCTRAGFGGDIEVFGLVNVWQKGVVPTLCEEYPEPIVLRYFDEADGTMKYIRSQEEIIAYIKALEQYFIDTDQIARVRIGADEPSDMERYRRSLEQLHEIAPSFKCATAINHSEFIEEFEDHIETITPSIGCVCKEYQRLMAHKAQFPHKKFLWYVCGSKAFPNNSIINPLIDNRSVGLLNDMLGLDGFLRWNFCLYSDDPREDVRYSNLAAGDLNFVYPGSNGSVLLSLRYKNLQRGFSDYEMIHTLREKDPAAADALLQKVFAFSAKELNVLAEHRSACGYTPDQFRHDAVISRDWNDYNTLKEELLAYLA